MQTSAARCTTAVLPTLVAGSTPCVDIRRSKSPAPAGFTRKQQANTHGRAHSVAAAGAPSTSERPVLLLDVMDTIVRDPFYEDMPAYFNCTLQDLFKVKHPTAWLDFEKGLISDEEFRRSFYADLREFDENKYEGLKACMYEGYAWLDGMEELLSKLLSAGYQLHAFSNYPQWYCMIEDKLELSRYIEWTAVSCHTGFRKPDPKAYAAASTCAGADMSNCIFVDDNIKNIEAATMAGMRAIHFQGAADLEEHLRAYGLEW